MFAKLKPYRKAIIGGLAAAVAMLYSANADDVITTQEWISIVIAGLGGGGLTYAVPNAPMPPKER